MATAHLPMERFEQRTTHRIGVLRLAVTLGAGSWLVFALCWLGTFIAFSSPTHAYIGLFTNADTQSLQALAEGGLWSLLFGALAGAVTAAFYNLFAFLDRR